MNSLHDRIPDGRWIVNNAMGIDHDIKMTRREFSANIFGKTRPNHADNITVLDENGWLINRYFGSEGGHLKCR